MTDRTIFNTPYHEESGAVPVTLRDSLGNPYVGAGGATSFVSFTPVLDTAIYADGDILFDTIAVASVFPDATTPLRLISVHVLDEDDQGIGFDLIFLNALTSLGTFNVAPSISDANARNIIGMERISALDYIDMGANRIATIGEKSKALFTGATTLWIAGITRGSTPTYTASGLKLKLGFGR